MHIPENYLSPSTCGVLGAVMVPIWLLSIRKVKETVPREKLPLLGVAAAFSFLAMMFNVPLPGGTTGHAVGGTLIAILLGPYAACLSVSVALLIQALFFGDGGILAFGANSFNMAFALPFTGYFVYHGVKRLISSDIIAAGIGSYVGINVAAFCAAVEFGIQPLLFTDAAGQALYCPYPLSISIPAMMIGLGVYLPFYMSLTAFLGSCVKLAYDKWSAHRDAEAGLSDEEKAAKDAAFQEQGLVVASGLLGGESIVGVILAFVSVGLSLLG